VEKKGQTIGARPRYHLAPWKADKRKDCIQRPQQDETSAETKEKVSGGKRSLRRGATGVTETINEEKKQFTHLSIGTWEKKVSLHRGREKRTVKERGKKSEKRGKTDVQA